MRPRPSFTPLVQQLPATVPFVGPEAQERARGRPFRVRLGANESGFGPAPSVTAAMSDAAGDMWKYCDPENYELRNALGHRLGVSADNIVVGEGIDGLLNLVVRLFVDDGTPVVTSLGAYPTFNFHVAGFGGRLVTVPYRNDREDLERLLDVVQRERAPLVYLSNPDNPMGTWWEAADVMRFADALPPTTMLVLDEAYGETAPRQAIPPLDVARPNLLRFRTFSKAYGLAGLRCGYAIGDADTIRTFEKVRTHYGVNRMAQVAALAALGDDAWLENVVQRVTSGRRRIAEVAGRCGLAAIPSATNFVTIDCGDDGPYALRIMNALLSRDVFVRKPMAPGLDRCIRVSVGPDADLDVFEAELPRALETAKS